MSKKQFKNPTRVEMTRTLSVSFAVVALGMLAMPLFSDKADAQTFDDVIINVAPATPWSATNLTLGLSGTTILNIINGGQAVTTGPVYTAQGATSSTSVMVTGPGSLWQLSPVAPGNASDIRFGNGASKVIIENGGQIIGLTGGVTSYGTGRGEITVNGVGSLWQMACMCGGDGLVDMTVENGGKVVSATGTLLGIESVAASSVKVTGAGSVWQNARTANFSWFGSADIRIEQGGLADFSENLLIATTNVYGLRSTGAGTVAITTGGQMVVGGTMTLAKDGGIANILVDGAGSQLQAVGGMIFGSYGVAEMKVTRGGVVTSNGLVSISSLGSSRSQATVDGDGSQWNINSSLSLGNNDSRLYITNGGKVTVLGIDISNGTGGIYVNSGGTLIDNGNTQIRSNSGDAGVLSIDGAGSSGKTHILYLGGPTTDGKGALSLSNNAALTADAAYLGYENRTTGTATIRTGASWTITGDLIMGNRQGSGEMAIESGGKVISTNGYVGYSGSGRAVISGVGSEWQNSGVLIVSAAGSGQMAISENGKVTSADGIIGQSSYGSVSVASGGAWVMTSDLTVGQYNSGTVNIESGGQVRNAGLGIIAANPGTYGSMTVSGAGSSWTNTGAATVGQSGYGELTLSDGGIVNAPSKLFVATDAGATGIVNIGAADWGTAAAPGSVLADELVFGAGNGRVVFNHTAEDYTFAAKMTGLGVVDVYSGTTSLTGANDYSGATTIYGGTWQAGGVNVFSAASSTNIHGDGVLALNGYSQQIDSIQNAGTIRMNTPTGTPGAVLTVGSYVGDGGNLMINTVLGTDNSATDKLVVTGAATGQTTLYINNVGGLGDYTRGDGILVIQAVGSGTTDIGTFALGSRVAVGAHDYFLYWGGNAATGGDANDKNWYLRNIDTTPPLLLGCADTGTCPVVPPVAPVVRPEVLVATTIQPLAIEYGYAMLDTLHERVGETYVRPLAPVTEERKVYCKDASQNFRCVVRVPVGTVKDEARWAPAGWARLLGNYGDHKPDSFQKRGPDYDYTFGGLQAGLDLYAREQADGTLDKAGIYVGYGQISSNVSGPFGQNGVKVIGKAGGVDMDAYTIGGYWTHHAASGWYTDAVVQGTWYSADAYSVLNQHIKPDGFGILASLEGGYAFKLNNGWTIEPQAQIAYQRMTFDSAKDAYGQFSFDDGESLRGRLGVRVTKSWNMAEDGKEARLITAWLRANVWHEFMGKTTTRVGTLSGEGAQPFNSYLGGTWGEIGAGVTAQLSDKVNLFATGAYNRSLDNKGRDGWDGRLGVTVKW